MLDNVEIKRTKVQNGNVLVFETGNGNCYMVRILPGERAENAARRALARDLQVSMEHKERLFEENAKT